MLPKVDVLEAVTESGAVMVRALDRLSSKADDLLAAAQGGPAGARKFLRDLGVELRSAIADAVEASAKAFEGRPGRNLDDFKVPAEAEEAYL